jgi:hypothetical protein
VWVREYSTSSSAFMTFSMTRSSPYRAKVRWIIMEMRLEIALRSWSSRLMSRMSTSHGLVFPPQAGHGLPFPDGGLI